MLTFKVNNEALVLDEDTSVQFVWRNPACNLDEFPGDVGLGIDIPVNDHNRMIFGNPERFERYADENIREFKNFEIRYGGVLLMAGTFVVQSANHERYSGWLRSHTGNIGKVHREKYITDSISFNEEKIFENKADYDPDTDEYGCPGVYNPDFFKEKGQKTMVTRLKQNPNFGKMTGKWKWYGYVQEFDDRLYLEEEVEEEDLTEAFLFNAGWKVNALNTNGTVKAPETSSKADPDSVIKDLKVNVVSPMLFLNYVVKKLFADAGFSVGENFMAEHEDLKKLVVYNNFDITKIEHFTTEITIVYDYWDERDNDPMVIYNPDLRSVGYTVDNISRSVNTFFYKDLLPKMKLPELVLGIQNTLNTCFHFVPGRKIIDIIDREGILTGEAIDIEPYLIGFWEINEKKKNTLKFSFSNDKNDLIFSERWEDLSDYRDKEKEPVNTWADLEALSAPETDEVRYVREANGYAQYRLWLLEGTDEETGESTQEKFKGWKLLSIGFQNAFLNYGQEETEEIKTIFSTLDGKNMANTRQKGNIRSELFAFETFSPRILFYHGNNTGSYETDTLSLDWERENIGLLDARWGNWSRFWSTRQPVETEAHFHLSALDDVIRNIYKKYRCRSGEFIIEEMRTEFRINEIGRTKIQGYKIDYAPRLFTLTDVWRLNEPIWIDERIDLITELNLFL